MGNKLLMLNKMANEAHKLIGISLSKIAQSRTNRSGVSLHKNLLVAKVLHKARYIFMEEAYQLVHGNNRSLRSSDSHLYDECHDDSVSEKNSDRTTSFISDWDLDDESNDDAEKLDNIVTSVNSTTYNKNNISPPVYQAHVELTYLNLDSTKSDESDVESEPYDEVIASEVIENNTLKRRRSEWELEEAVQSILPKRTKAVFDNNTMPVADDLVFLDDPDFLSDNNRLSGVEHSTVNEKETPSMEIDRLSSLVSYFSFTNLTEANGCIDELSNKTHSIQNTDLCSAQAKDSNDVLQPLQYLAMTV